VLKDQAYDQRAVVRTNWCRHIDDALLPKSNFTAQDAHNLIMTEMRARACIGKMTQT
jgi:hypothetical protein